MVLGRVVCWINSTPVLQGEPSAWYTFSALLATADMLKWNKNTVIILSIKDTMIKTRERILGKSFDSPYIRFGPFSQIFLLDILSNNDNKG